MTLREQQAGERSRLASVRDSSAESLFPAAEREPADALPVITLREEREELLLREVASLESELASLTLRQSRLHPSMEQCGEPLL